MRQSKPSTIYISGKTVERARLIEEATGIKAGRLFRQFVERYSKSLRVGAAHSSGSLAFVLPALAPWDVDPPKPFLDQADEAPGFDMWDEAFSQGQPQVTRVFLMGLTLEHPISNHAGLWHKFVSDGGKLQLLLQGDLNGGAGDVPQIVPSSSRDMNMDRLAARARTLSVLRELVDSNPAADLEVRSSGQVVIRHNSALIFRDDGSLDIHLEFGPSNMRGQRSTTLTLTAEYDPPDEIYDLMVKPIEAVWLRSIADHDFEHLNTAQRNIRQS